MGNCNFEGCKSEIHYVCQCLSSETFYCEIHLKEHLKTLDRNHNFGSIMPGLHEWTKNGFLKFLESEKLEKEKLITIILDFFAQNREIHITIIEKYLNELDSKWKDINDQIEKISEKEEGLLVNPLVLQPNSDAEKAENMLLNSLDSNLMLFYRLEQLKNKRLAILNKTKNDPETELDFRKTCTLYENNTSNYLLSQAYKEYVKDYQKLASLYLIYRNSGEIKLFIYDTEHQREELKILKSSSQGRTESLSIIQLPNGELFVYGCDHNYPTCNYDYIACIVNVLDKSYPMRNLPWQGSPHYFYTAIYCNKNIYCFGYRLNDDEDSYQYSARFDLGENRWIEIAPMEMWHNHIYCSIIFKENILFSENDCNLFLYSIEINSFSTIPFKFVNAFKILINIEERLYLIECGKNRWIYESEAGNEYNWQKISHTKIYDQPIKFYASYNKGEIYILLRFHECFREYFKFDLSQNKLIEIACYGDSLALENLDNKLSAIDCGINFDSSYNKIGNYPFYTALRLYQIEKLNKEIKNSCVSNNMWNYTSKGNILCELGRFLEAIEDYNEAIKCSYTNDKYKPYRKKAEALCNIGQYLEAIECYDKVISLKSNIEYAGYIEKGQILWDLGRNSEAMECYNEVIRLELNDEYCYTRKGDALHKLGRDLEALECYNHFIKIEPDHAWSYWKKGKVLHDLGQNLEAIECFNKSVEFNPENSIAFCYRGSLFNDLGKEEEAVNDFNTAYYLDSFINDDRNDSLITKRFELLMMLPKLLESAMKAKEGFQKIKDTSLKNPEILKETEEKASIIKEQRSQIIKRAVECCIKHNSKPIEEIKQLKIEIAEHQKTMIDIVVNLWELLSLHNSINE